MPPGGVPSTKTLHSVWVRDHGRVGNGECCIRRATGIRPTRSSQNGVRRYHHMYRAPALAVPFCYGLLLFEGAYPAFVGRWALSKLTGKGTTLVVADYSRASIVEFDAAGKKIHEIKGVKSP